MFDSNVVGSYDKEERDIKKLWLLSVCLLLFGLSSKVFGDEMEYTVIPIFSERQQPENTSYFELTLGSGQQETIHLEITNLLSETKEFSLEVNEGMTNSNGVLDYIRKIPRDPTLTYPMSELVSLPEKISVASGESLRVPLIITGPEEAFSGMVLGGVVVKPLIETTAAGAVINHYTHTIAIVLNGQPLREELAIHLTDIQISQRDFRNVIYLALQNPLARIVEDLEVSVQVRQAGSEKPRYEQVKGNMRMAPNSTMDFPVEIRDHFEEGDYEATITVKAEGQRWLFSESFTIEEEQAQALNELTIDEKQMNYFWLWLLTGSISLVSGLWYVGKKHLRRL